MALKLLKSSIPTFFLVMVGEVMRGTRQAKASCHLPGTKRRDQETSAAAVQRLVDTDFECIADLIEMSGDKTEDIDIKQSPTYGIRS